MDKDVVHVYSRILISHEHNEIMFFVAPWVQLESIILSEISQKEKDKYYMSYKFSLICGI